MVLLTTDSHVTRYNLAGTFAGLMDLYERNYISLRRLLPVPPPVGSVLVSSVSEGLPLHLHVDERFRYTTELTLTYYFQRSDGSSSAEPNLRVRIYHDARQAEVMSAELRRWAPFRLQDSELRARWRVNRFLYKWLNYSIYQGHTFRETA